MATNLIWGQILHCDVLEGLRRLPSNSVPLIVTSPPYNLKNSTGNGTKWLGGKGKSTWSMKLAPEGYGEHDDNMPHDSYVMWQREVIAEMLRVLMPDSFLFYNHKYRQQNGMLQTRWDILQGFPVRQEIVWQRDGGYNYNQSFFVPTTERIWMIAKGKPKLKQEAIGWGDVWKIGADRGNPHPAPFPVDIPKRCLIATGAEGVLDPFAGSGTTLVAAKQLGRRWLGIELSGRFCKMAQERLDNTQPSLF